MIGNIFLSPLKNLTLIRELWLSANQLQIPFLLVPFFNLSKLKSLDRKHNEIYAETEVHNNLTPKFQLDELYLSGNGYGRVFPKFYQSDLLFVDLSNIKIIGGLPN